MTNLSSLFSNFKTTLYRNYGENPGKMLVHTGVLGWILSSLAQVSAIVLNDKISTEQKSFLIPQEIADAGINIISFYLITSSFKRIASKLVSTGKLTTVPIKEFLKKVGLKNKDHIGNFKFNIEDLPNFDDIKSEYRPFKNGVDVAASVVGSVISCNIVTPILRNQYAAKKQQETIAKMRANAPKLQYAKGISIEDYQKLSAMKYSSSGSLKI
ncbi:hypothetical protein II810_04980 [bacterium]|nr:hypothetical protein [bacterium]